MLADLRAKASPESLGDATMLPYEHIAAAPSGIARTFGETVAQALVALEPGAWSGPLASGLGAHLVLITERRAGRFPELEDVRAEVQREYLTQRRQELKDAAYRKLREGYDVVVEPPEPQVEAPGQAAAETESEPVGG
jgi:hypothetical protein